MSESFMAKNIELSTYDDNGTEVSRVEIHYPRTDGHIKSVEIGLMDVRSSDNLQISYDFERDGWSIKQASRFVWDDGESFDQGWQEVAFVKAWGSEDRNHWAYTNGSIS